MLAFNRRFDIKRVAGLQVPMAMGLVGMLISTVFMLMLPWPLKLLVASVFVFSLCTVLYVAYYGDDIAFARVMLQSQRCQSLTSSECLTRV